MFGKDRLRYYLFGGITLALNLSTNLVISAEAQVEGLVSAPVRITQKIDESSLVTLHGNTHPLARAENDRGPAAASMPAARLLLILQRSAQQEANLESYLQSLQDPGSPNYHRWLAPEQFGQRFGASDADLGTIQGWLQGHGFTVSRVAKGRMAIEFSGTVSQVQAAFHTSLHSYAVNGQQLWANASDPQIPSALAPIVSGLAALNNFVPKAQVVRGPSGVYSDTTHRIEPAYTVGNDNIGYTIFLGPSDAATIYDTPTIYNANYNGTPYDGTGVTIGVAGDSNINGTQNANYRATFGLPDKAATIIVDGTDPGENGDAIEAYLDTEVSGGIAPNANVVLYTAADTFVNSGLFLAILRAIDDNQADILNVSFGQCEFAQGTAGNQYIYNLWQQAAAQGIAVVVSTGDGGSAGCDDPNNEVAAISGLAVNGLASTPYNVAVGGTDFNTLNSNLPTSFTQYVDVTNNLADHRSALGYIPEEPWNDTTDQGDTVISQNVPSSTGANIMAGGGGVSGCVQQTSGHCSSGYPLPSWQTRFAINNSGRNLPDVSFLAGNGLYGAVWGLCTDQDSNPATGGTFTDCAGTPASGNSFNLTGVGGTSAAAPAFAGILALVQQKVGSRLGQADNVLYKLATSDYSTVFHDITTGNNSVPCTAGTPDCAKNVAGYDFLSGYNAGTVYDAATGLGSVDASQLVANWSSAGLTATTSTLLLNGGTAPLNLTHGAPVSVNVGVAGSGGTPSGDIALVDNINPAKMPNSGSIGSFTLTSGSAIGTTTGLPGGSYNVSAHYIGNQTFAPSDSNAVPVTVGAESSSTTLKVVGFFDPATGKPATTAYYGFIYLIDAQPYGNSASAANPNGAATGTITFNNGSSALGTALLASNGIAELQTALLPGGTDSLTAAFPGDDSFQASRSAPVSFTVTPARTLLTQPTIQAQSNTAGFPQSITTSFKNDSLGAPPTGNVTFLVDAQSVGTAPVAGIPVGSGSSFSGGTATFTSTLIPGKHAITAVYSGDANYAQSPVSASQTVTISRAPASLSLVPSPTAIAVNQPLQITAAVSNPSGIPAATGTMTLTTPGYASPVTTLVSGSVIFTIPANSLPQGADTFTAAYSGDLYYGNGSGSVTVTVAAPTQPSVSLKGTNVTVTAGATTGNTSTITVTPSLGFTGAVALTYALINSPANAVNPPTFSFGSTSPVAITGTAAGTGILTVSTSASTGPTCASALQRPPRAPWYATAGAALACLVLFGIPGRRGRGRRIVGLILLFIALTGGVMACGGGMASCPNVVSPGTTAGNYTVTVTGTSGAITASSTVTITVN
jgi:hypothetical protein